jgi:hypothetical protein
MSKLLRSQGGIAAGALLALCLAAVPALAQGDRPVTSKKDMGDTVKVNVSGSVVLDYVWRSKEVTFFTEGFSAGPLTASDNENTFEGHAAVRIDAELSEKVSAVLELGTKRVDGGINEWGNLGAEPIQLREAGVRISEILNPAISLHVGLSNWAFDVRGRGSAFALDPRHSQSIGRNLNVVEDVGGGAGDALTLRAGFPEEMEPVGTVITYARDQITVNLALLPAVIEGGNSNSDEALYALDFWYNLDSVGKGSRLGLVIARHSIGTLSGGGLPGSTSHTAFFTAGGGLDVMLMDGALELYGEAYFQFGDAGRAGADDIDAAGMAVQVGLEYRFAGDMKPWVGLNFTMVSGDSDDAATSTDTDADAFMSYENVNDLAIIESMYLGFDWDSNYTAIKVSGGVALSVGAGKNNLEVSAILGFCRSGDDVDYGAPVGGEDALGNEIDVKVRWILNKQAAITGTFAYLTGSDILEESMGGSANPDAEDNAMLYTLGVDLRF